MEQILPAYGLFKETVIVMVMLYKNTKAMVRSPDGDTEVFDIVANKTTTFGQNSTLFST